MWAKQIERGFTIVELLIVIVVVAILAAITVVAYNGIQNRAYDSAIQSDLSVLRKKLELLKVDSGIYTYADPLLTFKATKNAYSVTPTTSYNLLFCSIDVTGQNYAVVALSKSGRVFYMTNQTGVAVYSSSWLSGQAAMCNQFGGYDAGIHNSRGYAADDITTGPWRSWTGGN